jgi:uncharacterized protein YjiS (DUF1127 family)
MVRFFMSWWQRWLEARTRSELLALSDHRLRDIGLRRDQVNSLYR